MSNDKQETIPMGKTVMVLVIPEPKVRKATAKPVRKHKDKTAYSRKAKHKTPEWGSFFTPKVKIWTNYFRLLLDVFGSALGLPHIFCHILRFGDCLHSGSFL